MTPAPTSASLAVLRAEEAVPPHRRQTKALERLVDDAGVTGQGGVRSNG